MRFTRGNSSWEELAAIPWFADLDARRLRLAARSADRVRVAAGTRLQQQGRHVGWLWIPVDGPLELRRNDVVVGEVPAGGAWGEPEVLLGLPSAVEVVATSTVTAVSLPARAFHGMLGEAAFAATVARRQARASLLPQPARVTATARVSPAA
jgi:CRP-like cAMP-binding protein